MSLRQNSQCGQKRCVRFFRWNCASSVLPESTRDNSTMNGVVKQQLNRLFGKKYRNVAQSVRETVASVGLIQASHR